jgi:hypothetical protein
MLNLRADALVSFAEVLALAGKDARAELEQALERSRSHSGEASRRRRAAFPSRLAAIGRLLPRRLVIAVRR